MDKFPDTLMDAITLETCAELFEEGGNSPRFAAIVLTSSTKPGEQPEDRAYKKTSGRRILHPLISVIRYRRANAYTAQKCAVLPRGLSVAMWQPSLSQIYTPP
ncbi:hypothetical protein I7I48_04626 [Histoplasma ohiense]|nr:hypothetical protein I7I48_04626 [Histoplasma ohiense (nom. inval.)]